MLDRASISRQARQAARERRRARRRQEQRRYRARQRASEGVAAVTYTGACINMLVRLGYLPDGATFDRHEIGRAIERLLANVDPS